MPTITLDSIRESLEAKYEPLRIPFGDGREVVLVQALRLPQSKRDAIGEIQDRINGSEGDTGAAVEAMRDLIRVAGTGPVDDFLRALEGDDELALLGEILRQYSEATQAGNPSASPA